MLAIISLVNSFGTNLERVTMNKYGATLFNMRKSDKGTTLDVTKHGSNL